MLKTLFTGLSLLLVTLPVSAALNVFACEPEWASLMQELGSDKVKVFSATTAQQDPHRIQARPSLIAKMRRADLIVCTGAELETGWLPVLLRRAANPKIQPGQPGYFEAAQYVTLLDKPERIDRAEGDIHAAGDPHIHLNPHNISRITSALTNILALLDPENTIYYTHQRDDFLNRWQRAITGWEKQAAPLRGLRIVSQHKSWIYLIDWLGMKEVTRLEPKPGIPPSTTYLTQVLTTLQQQPARAVLITPYQNPQASEWLHSRIAIPVVELPYTVGGDTDATTLFGLFDSTITKLLAVTEQ
ncbi:MAG: zinc ABC transporter substrate-binding protein [Gammaproteobacteria bacterium SG8_15]|nr:MAG: zinc ABC transporter substrate-binding protein [Gammaproteobacteria bacterium SG8_15]